ncbi:hypothetical protein [Desulfosporosinus sp.]|uniref:hypothetical protein n=1 Tax=Desulfosporosinus sp. TaxID=157907 RepID=UPI0025C6AD34|nr:hypothetical protein [Desulfosporosinus sp.]MBC2721411.1 hypothetical protein [Desulfosporosinus sp.]MBC2728070.1 hypothetical protein [Desulfosporosinus sp.]
MSLLRKQLKQLCHPEGGTTEGSRSFAIAQDDGKQVYDGKRVYSLRGIISMMSSKAGF